MNMNRWRILTGACVALAASACASSSTPRVVEVSTRYLHRDEGGGAPVQYVRGQTSITHGMVGPEARRAHHQEYFVRWRPATVHKVTFEYRQVNDPGVVHEKSLDADGRVWTVLAIDPDAFKTGGPVSAWRVRLWDATGQVLSEKHSAVWQ